MQESIDIDHKMKLCQINEVTGFTVLTLATEFALVFGEDYLTTFEGFTQKYRSHSGSCIEGKHSFSRFREFAAVYDE